MLENQSRHIYLSDLFHIDQILTDTAWSDINIVGTCVIVNYKNNNITAFSHVLDNNELDYKSSKTFSISTHNRLCMELPNT